MGLAPARVWVGQAIDISPTEWLKLRRHIMEVNGLEVEENLSTMATLLGAEGVWAHGEEGSRGRGGSRSLKF